MTEVNQLLNSGEYKTREDIYRKIFTEEEMKQINTSPNEEASNTQAQENKEEQDAQNKENDETQQ